MSTLFGRGKKVRVTAPERLGLIVGLPAIVAIVPWVPQDLRAPLSDIIYGALVKLQKKWKNKQDLLLELSAASSSNKPLKETLQQAQDAINQFQENQWKIKGKSVANIIGDAASKINQYSTILGPAILAPATQFSPFLPSVVWGVFSMFLKIAINDVEMGTKLIFFINSYMDVSEIYAGYWKLHQHSRGRSSQRVQELIGRVEEEIRKFILLARKSYFDSRSAVRIFRSTNVPFSAELQPICDGISHLTKQLDTTVDLAYKEEQKRHEILNWVSKLAYEDPHINEARKREKGTCGWLRKKEQFLSWINSSSSSVLWVHGNAGFGKSVLMSSIVDHFQETLPNGNPRCNHVAYFYCVHDAKETLDILVILSSILKQMVASFPDIADKVTDRFENYKYRGKLGGLHLEAIMELLIATMEQASSPLFILIDALDECNEATRAELLKTLMPLILDSGPVPSKIIKICIFSRPYDDIRQGLSQDLKNFLEIPIIKTDNMDDMLTFLNCQIASSRSLEAVLKKEQGLRNRVIQDLVVKADGMFLWVSLHQMSLYHERDPRSIKHYLQDLPNSETMEESYIRIIKHINRDSPGNRKLAGTVLHWLLCAIHPLSVKELIDALCFLGLAEGTDELKRDIIHICHGLVQIEMRNHEEYFRFIHFSVHQALSSYFEQQFNPSRKTSIGLHDLISGTGGDEQKLNFNMSLHKEMAQICIKYILNSGILVAKELLPADEIYNCRQELDLLAAEKPFFLYASQAWVKHFHAASDYSTDLTNNCLELFRNAQNLQLSFQIFWFKKYVENFPRGSTPLHIASYFGLPSIISSLLADMSGPFMTDNQFRTPVYWAAYHGDYTSLKAFGLITTGDCDKQVLGEALLAAVQGDQVNLITELLSRGRGADPDACVRDGKTALFYATLKGDSNLAVVRQLIKAGANLEPKDPIAPPLQAAAMAGALEITQYFLHLNVDVNAVSHNPSGLPLKTAVLTGQHELAKLLLNSGATIALAGGKTLIELTSMVGDPKMIDIILQHSHTEGGFMSEGEEAIGKEDTLPHPLPEHKPPASSSSSNIAGLRIGIRQGLRVAKMGNMGQEIINLLGPRGQQLLVSKFEALDFGYIEACESIVLEAADEVVRAKPTAVFLQSGVQYLLRALVQMGPKVQSMQQTEYYERLLKIISRFCIRLGDCGYDSYVSEIYNNIERSLLEAIKTQAQTQTVDQLFLEVEVGMQSTVVMERYPLALRVHIRTYLTGIMAIIPPEEGIVRLTKFLDGVVASGLSNKCSRPGNWRTMVVFIEIANCVYAYGYKRLYPQIQLKVALLRMAAKNSPKLTPDRIMMDQLEVVVSGRSDWQWDANEAPWWHYCE